MLRVVVDTNIFISGLLKSSNNRQLIILLQNSKFTLLISPETLDELINVISRPKFHKVINRIDAEELIEIIKTQAVLVKPRQKFDIIKEDLNDNRFLELAFEAKVDLIVSGDHHLLLLKTFHGIPIITSKEFIIRLSENRL